MKRRAIPPGALDREEHPALDTFERVMTSGVVVDRGADAQRRERWFDVSVAGLDLLAVESDASTQPLSRRGRTKFPGKG